MEFIEYSKCTTCKKAKKFLMDNNIEFIDREINIDIPSYDELKKWVNNYDVKVNKLFNTSGLVYKSLNLKDKLDNMSEDEKLKLLSTNGMLVKRPILVNHDKVLVGFKQDEWEKYFKI